ncbi:MAG: 2-C-methyl-D-erythritol 4-phosphate cytidylyltransferase [Clostridiales bacterium]|nr:2-C-methyl-D-erythritol 4-phosphate cytidylyltransferase [Clostridiales bacterium]
MKEKSVAIVLAAGSGSRMKSNTPKQYMDLGGKPVIYYSLYAFEISSIDEVILVVGENEIDYNWEHIVKKYNFTKVSKVIAGGDERYLSVFNGLKAIDYADYVLIHDGARPFITIEILEKVLLSVKEHKACVVGMPSKDTIKISDSNNVITSTPDRKYTWIIQTPQAFSYSIIMGAYSKIIDDISKGLGSNINITDDAMVVEHTSNYPIKLIEGSYLNIKVTTPEDLIIGDIFLKKSLH